jgi:hypothetical protein
LGSLGSGVYQLPVDAVPLTFGRVQCPETTRQILVLVFEALLLYRYIQPPPARGLFVSRPAEAPQAVQLISGRQHVSKGNDVWLVRLEGCLSRNDAEGLRNYRCACASRCRIATSSPETISSPAFPCTGMRSYHAGCWYIRLIEWRWMGMKSFIRKT